MKKLYHLMIVVMSSFLCSCTNDVGLSNSSSLRLTEIAMRDVLEDCLPPKHFQITPHQARMIAGKAWKLSLKHKFVCYYDDRYYYFYDIFWGPVSVEKVFRSGVRIDGKTGVIESRRKK